MEFLGDAVIEFLTRFCCDGWINTWVDKWFSRYICMYLFSDHLYHMFPDYTDGQLVIYRKALICNQNLATIAKVCLCVCVCFCVCICNQLIYISFSQRLELEKYMLSTKWLVNIISKFLQTLKTKHRTYIKRVEPQIYDSSLYCSFELSTQDGFSHAQANTLEALMGAVYLDGGLKHSREVLANLLFPEKVKQ